MKVADIIKFFEKSSKIGNNSNLQDSSSINNQKTTIKNPTYYNFIIQNDQKLLSKISDNIEIIKNKINLNIDIENTEQLQIYKSLIKNSIFSTKERTKFVSELITELQKVKNANYFRVMAKRIDKAIDFLSIASEKQKAFLVWSYFIFIS